MTLRACSMGLLTGLLVACATPDGAGLRQRRDSDNGNTDLPGDDGRDPSRPSPSGADVSPGVDAGAPPSVCSATDAPPALPAKAWSWMPESGMTCGRGGTTGWGINPGTSKRLVMLLMGGGGCFDAASCAGQDPAHAAANLDGYGEGMFHTDVAGALGAGTIFDRNAAENPFKDDSFVFVPYCTGDFHSGSTTAPYGIRHAGFTNMGVVAKRLGTTFCGTYDKVVLTGTSAGGWGAVFNYEQVANAVRVRVDLVDDSGPPMGPDRMPLQAEARAAWGAAANAPAGCAACKTGWNAYLPYLSAKYPMARMSLVQSRHDFSVCPFFGMPQPAQCEEAVDGLTASLSGLPNVKTWVSNDFKHVFLGAGFLGATTAGVPLRSFLNAQVHGDAAWRSAGP